MKTLKLILVAVLCTSCASMTLEQRTAIETTAMNLARVAVSAAATVYGGPAAGALAAAGLDGLATVIQGYVGNKIPPAVVTASPGVAAVGPALATLIAPNHVVTQADADKVAQAAAIAAQLKTVVVVPHSP